MKRLNLSFSLTDEQYAALERITKHHNQWAKDNASEMEGLDVSPLSAEEYLVAALPGWIRKEDREVASSVVGSAPPAL